MNENAPRSISNEQFTQTAKLIEDQLKSVIVGQEALVHDLLVTLLASGHALLEGVPGLGKTILIRTDPIYTRPHASRYCWHNDYY